MAKELIIKYLSLTLLTLIICMPLFATGFIWFNWLLIVKIEGSLLWLTICSFVGIIYFNKNDDEVNTEQTTPEP